MADWRLEWICHSTFISHYQSPGLLARPGGYRGTYLIANLDLVVKAHQPLLTERTPPPYGFHSYHWAQDTPRDTPIGCDLIAKESVLMQNVCRRTCVLDG